MRRVPEWIEVRHRRASSLSLRRLGLGTALLVVLSPRVANATEGLNLIPDLGLLAALIAAFIALVYPLNLLLFKPIFAVLDARAEQIEGARQRAEQLKEQADESIARYREAVQDVRREAELVRRARLDDARREQAVITSDAREAAELNLSQMRMELAGAVDETRRALRDQVEDLARHAAERIVGRQLS